MFSMLMVRHDLAINLDESYNKKSISSEITESDVISLTWVFETNKGLEKFK